MRPDPDTPPVVQVTRGNPTPEELAALVLVLLAAAGRGAEPDQRQRRIAWANPARRMGSAPLSQAQAWSRSR